ncbi:hypothetical protein ACER0C_006556 [Sarotherodon galilaeus]
MSSIESVARHMTQPTIEYPAANVSAGQSGSPQPRSLSVSLRDQRREVRPPPSRAKSLLTSLLLDLIKKSAPARIINASSTAHSWGSINLEDLNSEKHYNKNKAYAQSKLANVLFTRSLAKRLEGTGVTTYSLHPGVVQTELWRHLNGVQQFFMKMISPFTKTSVQGAQTTIYCSVDPSLEKESGGYYSDCAPANCSAAAKDDKVAEKLWELSCSLLSLTWD